jgi:ankyrin repeat protein
MSPSDSRLAPHNLEHQHKLAKQLLRAAREGDAAALARIRAHRTDADEPQLAHAQLAIAREAGFASWPELIKALQREELTAFRDAVKGHDVAATRRVLESSAYVREHINDPIFAFGGRALHAVSSNTVMLDLLLSFGADVTLKSDWENGPYSVLDSSDDTATRFLLTRGATLTANAAARLGWFEELQQIVEADPASVHQRGGDGQQPLHQAKTVAIADYLLDHGAGIDVRCIDHKTTPAQYALVDRPDVCGRLLERGASADIFMPARLGDAALAERLLDADPSCLRARVNAEGYAMVPPLTIYCWTLGWYLSPHDVAFKYEQHAVFDVLIRRSPAIVRFVQFAMDGDAHAARALAAAEPALAGQLRPGDHSLLAQAIFHGKAAAAELMLDLGFDPTARGTDGGTALHMACWMGNLRLVERLLALNAVPIGDRDPTHASPPLGWAVFGSVHRRAKDGDYLAVIDRLVAAGADVRAPGNGNNATLIEMADGNADVQAKLRRLGA